MKLTLITIIVFLGKVFFTDSQLNAEKNRLQADFQSLNNALEMYKINAGNYPSTEQGLKALIEKPDIAPRPKRWLRLMNKEALDPWNRKYQYKLVNNKIQLWSKGANLKKSEDDIYFPPKKVAEQVVAPDGE